MVLDEQISRYDALDHWFKTPQGCRAAHAFSEELALICEHLSGQTLLQLGHCGENVWLPLLAFRNKWLATPSGLSGTSSLVTSLTTLPLARNSVDCVVAPFTLEAFGPYKNPIDEIDRVLKPMGYAIFWGINPCGLWGMTWHFSKHTCFGAIPISVTSAFFLKRAMLQRGYRQCALMNFYYIPPVRHPMVIHALEFLNEMGKMLWPFPAGFYCLVVQKYEPCSPSLSREIGYLPQTNLSHLA